LNKKKTGSSGLRILFIQSILSNDDRWESAGGHRGPPLPDNSTTINSLVGEPPCGLPLELMDILRIILAILLPPLGVFLQVGFGKHFWLNILLTLLGYIPGIVHAVWVIAKY
jgi:uncharacterized membrane protein YqaE (UPF0057 family)